MWPEPIPHIYSDLPFKVPVPRPALVRSLAALELPVPLTCPENTALIPALFLVLQASLAWAEPLGLVIMAQHPDPASTQWRSGPAACWGARLCGAQCPPVPTGGHPHL